MVQEEWGRKKIHLPHYLRNSKIDPNSWFGIVSFVKKRLRKDKYKSIFIWHSVIGALNAFTPQLSKI